MTPLPPVYNSSDLKLTKTGLYSQGPKEVSIDLYQAR